MKKRCKNVAVVMSGGKDGILSYKKAIKAGYNVEYLINLFTEDSKVSFHNFSKTLVKMQAGAMGKKLIQKQIVKQNEVPKFIFEQKLKKILLYLKNKGIRGLVFGYVLKGDYQGEILKKICGELNLRLITPNLGKKSEKV